MVNKFLLFSLSGLLEFYDKIIELLCFILDRVLGEVLILNFRFDYLIVYFLMDVDVGNGFYVGIFVGVLFCKK